MIPVAFHWASATDTEQLLVTKEDLHGQSSMAEAESMITMGALKDDRSLSARGLS